MEAPFWMKILYKNKTVERQFSSQYSSKWKYPKPVEIKLRAAENLFESASTLQDIVSYRPFHFHQLKGDRKHEWSIYLGNTGYRITLIPCDEQGKNITSGDIIGQCRMIKVVLVTEVSNHYE